MSQSAYVTDVTTEDFIAAVVEKSREVPVLVDFWADWCQPCHMLAPVLERVVESYGGKVLLAKVDTDAEPELAAQLGVRSLPSVKLLRDGAVVEEFVGVRPESVIRAMHGSLTSRFQIDRKEYGRAECRAWIYPRGDPLAMPEQQAIFIDREVAKVEEGIRRRRRQAPARVKRCLGEREIHPVQFVGVNRDVPIAAAVEGSAGGLASESPQDRGGPAPRVWGVDDRRI